MTLESIPPWRRGSLVVGAIGLAVCALGLLIDARAVAEGYLAAALFWLNIGLGALAVLLVHQLTGGAWGRFASPVLAAAGAMLPWLAALFLPLLFVLRLLYPWAAAAGNGASPTLAVYLSPTFFAARTVVAFAIWIALCTLLTRALRAGIHRPRLASAGLVLYVITMTIFAIDWIVSRNPVWYSTASGFVLSGAQLSAALAFACVAFSMLPLAAGDDRQDRLQDLGNLLLSAILFLAYAAFMEFLIIWEGDLPAEIAWFVVRRRGIWPDIAIAMVLLQLALPMLLLARPVKRLRRVFALICGIALAGSLLVAIWLAGPGQGEVSALRWPFTAAAVAGIGGVCVFAFLQALQQRPAASVAASAEQAA